MKRNFIKILISLCVCASMLITTAMPSMSAWWDGFKAEKAETKLLIDISNITQIFDAGAVPSSKNAKGAKYCANWKNHKKTTYLRFNTVARDWSDCNTVCMDIYSEKATNAIITFMVYADYVPTPGKTMSYFMYDIKLDWEGMKTVKIPTSDFKNGNFADWSKINKAEFYGSGWNAVPHEDSNIYINSVYGLYSEQEEDGETGVISMSVSEENKKKVYTALASNTVVMNFADNAVKNGKLIAISLDERISTWDGVSVAPISFFENILEMKTQKNGGEITITSDGKTLKIKEGDSTYTADGKNGQLDTEVVFSSGRTYIPLVSALNALGKNAVSYDMLTLIGDTQANDLFKNKVLKKNLEIMLCAKENLAASITKDDWKLLKDKWRKYLTGDENKNLDDKEIKAKIKALEDRVPGLLAKMNKGSDILALFGDTPCTATTHMTSQFAQMYYLAEAYGTYGTKYYKDKKLKKEIIYSLDWLYENLYGQDEIEGKGWRDTGLFDWWDWYCGSAKCLCDALMIMEADLTKTQIKKYLSLYEHLRTVMRTGMKPNVAASRVYTGTAVAALFEDAERMTNMVNDYNLLLVPVKSGNGTQEDGLYKTHDYFAYSTLYGVSSLLDRLTKVQSILGGTAFDFATPYKYATCNWMYETFGPIMYNGYMTNAQSGRGKNDEDVYTVYAIAAAIDLIGVFGIDDDVRLKQLIKRNIRNENISKIKGSLEMDQFIKLHEILADETIEEEPYYKSKVYYTGDAVSHQRDDFGFALSMSSSRIAPWESIDGSNLTGWYQGDGMLYTYIDTDPTAYSKNYWKYANPYHMPGTTVDTQERIATSIADSADVLTNQNFVGAVEFNNLYSTAAMQLESYHNDNKNASLTNDGYGGDAPYHESSLMAKKAWFMFDDELVALGSDINADDGFEVQTIIENRKLVKNEKIQSAGGGQSIAEPYRIVSVTASSDDGNVVDNTIDSDYTTRWSAEGDVEAVYELEQAVPIGYVGIAQYNGIDGKQAIFTLEASLDGITWSKIWDGKASGTTISMEAYDMKNTVAKYVKYSGHGRTNSVWNSVTELKIFPPTSDGSMPVDSERGSSSNEILGTEQITVDGKLLEKASTYKKSFTNPSWMHIEGIAGYWLPSGGRIEIDKVTNTSNFLEMWLSHGQSPKGGTYSYVVLPKKTSQETSEYAKNPDIQILSNTEKLQAVKENKLGLCGIVFWEAGSFENITASKPMIMMTGRSEELYEITLSDPTQLLTEATVTIEGSYEVAMCDERLSVEVNGNSSVVKINFDGSKGRSLSLKLKIK